MRKTSIYKLGTALLTRLNGSWDSACLDIVVDAESSHDEEHAHLK
ncbi:hypothetical protein OTK49_01020 [Vibrio coralliirubri]|nr:hypothetical protein [Vibrio coralliirubri]MCY9861112.1 hypothetical protein [Vibrio coralliirubri]